MSGARLTQGRRNLLAASVIAMAMALIGFSVLPALGADVHEPHVGHDL